MSWDTNYYKTYIPSAALSISFTCAYATLTTGHFALFRRENVNFGVILVTAGLLQVAGHIARTVTHYHPNNLIAYSVQLLILLLGPNLFVIVAFIFAGQLGQYAIPGKATFQRRWMAFNAVLMFFNVAAMFLQIFGGVRLVQPLLGQSATYGEWIAAGGLGLQALLLMMFVGAIVGTAKYREKRVVVPGMMGGISSSTMMASACFVCLVLAASNIAKVVVFAYPKSVLGPHPGLCSCWSVQCGIWLRVARSIRHSSLARRGWRRTCLCSGWVRIRRMCLLEHVLSSTESGGRADWLRSKCYFNDGRRSGVSYYWMVIKM